MKMRKFVLAVAALFGLSSSAYGAFAIFQTFAGPPQIACNLVTGVASVGGPCTSTTACNGSGDDAPAFKAANTWGRANQGSSNQVVLTIPTGSNCVFNSNQSYSGVVTTNTIAAGINNFILEGTGATISAGTSGFRLGGGGVCYIGIASASGCSARLQSVSPGASTVSLTAASFSAGYISRFAVGNWVMVGGLDTQGQYLFAFGDPPNNTYFEFRQITAICNNTGPCTGGATITLDRPLTKTYLSTWPLYNAGDNFHSDNGGPATIYKLNDTWAASFEYRGLTIDNGSAQTYAEGRYVTYRNVTISGVDGAIPTQNEIWSAYGSSFANVNMETDKLVGTMILDNTTIKKITVQSSSMDSLVIRNNSNITDGLYGTPTSAAISDTTLNIFRPGATAYGTTNGPVTCTRCAVTDFQFGGTLVQNRVADYSMSGGVISFANTNASGSDPDQRVFVPPNGNVFWSATGFTTAGLFNVQAISQDPTNTLVQTNEAGGFPALTNITPARPHPAPQFTCDTCTGDPELVATSVQAGATPLAPLGTYSSRSYAPTSSPGTQGDVFVRGKIVSLTIDVTTASTHTGAITLNATSQFNNLSTVKQSNWTSFSWGPQINLKQTGTRVITPAGVTCNGVGAPTGCSGDSLGTTLPEAVWIADKLSPYVNGTFSGGVNPVFTMTIRTDQGVVP